MNTAQRILILSGLALISYTMAYGVAYALFDEHQTLVSIGTQMATGFMEAAKGNIDAGYAALDSYGALTREYHNEVHSHGHWGMLSLILIVLGLSFNHLALEEKHCIFLACVLAASAALFPLGVLLQIGPLAGFGKILSVIGSIGMVLGLLATVYGLLLKPDPVNR